MSDPQQQRHPTLLARPRRVDEVVQLIDVMPTILELVTSTPVGC